MNYLDKVAEHRHKQNKQKLSPNTTKDYVSAYNKLKHILGDDLIECCSDKDNTKKLIDAGLSSSRIRNLYNAYLNLMYAYDVDEEITVPYKLFVKNHQIEYIKSQKSNQLTSQSQIENMITFPQLNLYIKQLRRKERTEEENIVLMILEISKITPYRINEFSNMWLNTFLFYSLCME